MNGDVDIYAIIYGGRKLQGIYAIFWFVTCLFITQQLFTTIFIKIIVRKVYL